jgi:hypothetical protein
LVKLFVPLPAEICVETIESFQMRIERERRILWLRFDLDAHFFGALVPKVTGVLLEIWDAVRFIEDFDTEDGFDYVFESDDADGGAEFVGDEHDVEPLGDQALEERINGCVFRCDGDG